MHTSKHIIRDTFRRRACHRDFHNLIWRFSKKCSFLARSRSRDWATAHRVHDGIRATWSRGGALIQGLEPQTGTLLRREPSFIIPGSSQNPNDPRLFSGVIQEANVLVLSCPSQRPLFHEVQNKIRGSHFGGMMSYEWNDMHTNIWSNNHFHTHAFKNFQRVPLQWELSSLMSFVIGRCAKVLSLHWDDALLTQPKTGRLARSWVQPLCTEAEMAAHWAVTCKAFRVPRWTLNLKSYEQIFLFDFCHFSPLRNASDVHH